MSPPAEIPPAARSETWRVWARIGLQSFGGPAAQIALMHRILVTERRWLDETQFLRALGFCMLLPGPEAMQLAAYAGWRLRGVTGGLVAGLWFVMPGALLLLGLATLYVLLGQLPVVGAVFLGIKAAVLAMIVEAMVRLSGRALRHPVQRVLALGAFLALALFHVPFPVVVLGAAIVGSLALREHSSPREEAPSDRVAWSFSWGSTARTVAIWGILWIGPLAGLTVLLGGDHILSRLSWFFSKLAVVTFGGAYAVLSYVVQDVVVQHGWLEPSQMVDALGLAETTPGPLILVNLFVAFLASANAHPGQQLALGLAGAAVALWATFVPCFLWIFAGAPYMELVGGNPRLRAALAGITAAVLGVIANLSYWFAMNVLFARTTAEELGPLRWTQPVLSTLQPLILGIALLCGVLLIRFRRSVHVVLGVSVLASMVYWLASR